MNVMFGTSCSLKSSVSRVLLGSQNNISILEQYENKLQCLLPLWKVLEWYNTRVQAREEGAKFFRPHIRPICANLLQEKEGGYRTTLGGSVAFTLGVRQRGTFTSTMRIFFCSDAYYAVLFCTSVLKYSQICLLLNAKFFDVLVQWGQRIIQSI